MNKTDLLIGKNFTVNPCICRITGVLSFHPSGKKGAIKSILESFEVIEIDKEGFCIRMKNQPHRIEFADCKLIKENEE